MADAIRNSAGLWINSQVFREEAINFQKTGMYTPDPWGSPAWVEYWEEQRRRIIYGYTVGNATITGEHYFYLNFCPIERVKDTDSKVSRKVLDFPDFWDGDYEYFWVREIARKGVLEAVLGPSNREIINQIMNLEEEHRTERTKKILDSLYLDAIIKPDHYWGGKNLVVGKSRRRGYSYKASSASARNFIINPNSLIILGAADAKYLYPKGLMTMAVNYINFLNVHTAFVMPTDEINRQHHIKASYIEYQDGAKKVGGFKSEILALSYNDNPDAARGKDAYEVLLEEAGAFGSPGLLKASYRATEDCVKAGVIKTGMITVFGTSGDLEGGTADYKDMFENPDKYGMIGFQNTWDNAPNYVGFFHPANRNLEGFYDKQGNSDLAAAKTAILREREIVIENGGTSIDLQQLMQEKPLSPSEAFTAASVNTFPVLELNKQLTFVKHNNLNKIKGQPVQLYRDPETNEVKMQADLRGELNPIETLDGKVTDKTGAVMIYESPIENAPFGSYCIGYDPVTQDEGTSNACVVVFKKTVQGSATKNMIVATWLGRNQDNDDNHKVVEMLAELYNSKVMFENMSQDTKNYFRRIRKLHLLALQPDAVISKAIKKSKVARVFGCHMTMELKADGEKYINSWLLENTDYDENGHAVQNLNRIYSLRMLEELINYRSRSNKFDMCSALMMCMFQREETAIQDSPEYKVSNNDKLKKLNTLFRRR